MKNSLVETERLIVRRLLLSDVDLLYKYSQEEITKRELPDEVYESIEKTTEMLEFLISNYDSKYPLVYGIKLKEKSCIIGHISLSNIDKGIEIGYAIGTDYQRRGYASEIIGPFVDWSKKHLKLDNIYGIAKAVNVASWKILEKNGFTFLEEGIYKNYFNGKYPIKMYMR
jgi:RimJ/RimL family protein N-acetyltransferase